MSWTDMLPSFSKDTEKTKEKENAKDHIIADKEELIRQLTERIRTQQAELGWFNGQFFFFLRA